MAEKGDLTLVAHDASPSRPPHAPQASQPPRGRPPAIAVAIDRPLARADVLGLRGRIRRLLGESAGQQLVCDVGALTAADLGTVDALARLQLAARRSGGRLRLDNASPELRQLLALVGLRDVVPCVESAIEPGREAEDGEQPLRIEEEGDPGDPVA